MAEEYTVSDSKTGKPEHYQDQDVIETSVNTDGRNQYDWESRYPENARKEMKSEAIYIGIILFVSFVLLICIWCGLIGRIGGHIGLESKIVTSLEGIILYFFSGLMGGTIFGLKYFYRVVARGYWSQDRKYWRIFSPWISACIAFVVGCMVLSGYINAAQSPSFATEICVGFITGYFADDAVGKMSEVATALFGSGNKTVSSSKTDTVIIQKRVISLFCGHISNERRVAKDLRDWRGEFDVVAPPRTFRISLRNWRKKVNTTDQFNSKLMCPSDRNIRTALTIPCTWVTSQKIRVHFEWVYDGDYLYLVQADEEKSSSGIDPTKLSCKSEEGNKSTDRNFPHCLRMSETSVRLV